VVNAAVLRSHAPPGSPEPQVSLLFTMQMLAAAAVAAAALVWLLLEHVLHVAGSLLQASSVC
jgi:type VI protein secretion system component VasF